jgi:hypothetical protein
MAKNAAIVAAQMRSDTAAINAKLEAARKAAVVELGAVSAASAARYNKVVKTVENGVEAARKWSNRRFGKVYEKMAKDRATLDRDLGASVANLNDQLAKQSALADSRFSTTVKNIKAARLAAAKDVSNARKYFTTQMVALTSKIKQQETRLRGDIQVVSAMVISDKANQVRINNKVNAERKKIVALANKRHSSNVRARGMLRKLMDQNKAAAMEEVSELAKKSEAALAITRAKQAHYVNSFAKDLTKATKKLHLTLSKNSAHQEQVMSGLKAKLTYTAAATAGALRATKAMFKSRVNTLVNAITANAAAQQRGIRSLTHVATQWKHASAADRKLIRVQRSAMKNDLDKRLARAIQLGEARAKACAQRIAEYQKGAVKRFLRVELTEKLENAADDCFKAISGKRNKIADNYLSLKAYAISAKDDVIDYRGKKKGSLSSIGDLLATLGALSSVKIVSAPGLGLGGNKSPPLFSGKTIKQPKSLSKINGLVNEFTKSVGQVRMRWPLGLGKYLLDKLEEAMMGRGVLEVDKISGKRGNYVFINGRSVGLSNKLNDFSKLAAPMGVYESTLAKLTAQLTKSSKGKKPQGKIVVKPPEWQGK